MNFVQSANMATRLPRWRLVLPVLAMLWGVYLAGLHPWLMNWGATSAEVQMSLPGDDPALTPDAYFTRAISIDAPPATVWPWIVQMGQDRAGFYSNTWLENVIGSDIHNADTLYPGWQARVLGDSVPLARRDLLFGVGAWGHTHIIVLEPERAIADIPARFVLLRAGENETRLLFRESLESQGPIVTRLVAWDAMHFVMVQRMLRGVKERAEQQPLVPPALLALARAGWIVAGAGVLALFVLHRRWLPWLAVAVVLLPALLATGDWDAALAGFLAITITLAGALAFGRRWWPAFTLIAATVLTVLLLAPDAYTAFGLAFTLAVVLEVVAAVRASSRQPHIRAARSGIPA